MLQPNPEMLVSTVTYRVSQSYAASKSIHILHAKRIIKTNNLHNFGILYTYNI